MHVCYKKEGDTGVMITSGYGFVMNRMGISSGNKVFLGKQCCGSGMFIPDPGS